MRTSPSAIAPRIDFSLAIPGQPILYYDEMIFYTNPEKMDFYDIFGTRAQLESEGVIPAGAAWPKEFAEKNWRAEGFDFSLQRTRPPGAKGQRQKFITCDWWFVRVRRVGRSYGDYVIDRKIKDVEEEIYRQSHAGRVAFKDMFDRYWSAVNDEKFQAFKTRIPGLTKTNRTRTTLQGEST